MEHPPIPAQPDRALTPPHDTDSAARDLAAFLAALHTPAPHDAPRSPVCGVPLPARTGAVAKNLGTARRILPPGTADHLDAGWQAAVTASGWSSAPVWCHGDLHPADVLVGQGRISTVIDFGDLTAGDPATDFCVAWSLVPAKTRHRFWDAFADGGGQVDDALVLRARGWAIALALVLVRHSADVRCSTAPATPPSPPCSPTDRTRGLGTRCASLRRAGRRG